MSLTIFGVAPAKLCAALAGSLQGAALEALRWRQPPRWSDPFATSCWSRRFGKARTASYTWVVVAGSRLDLVRYLLADLATQPPEQRPRLIVIAADPTACADFKLRAEDWSNVFGVAFELWLPERPPSPQATMRFAEEQRAEGVVLVSPSEAYSEALGWQGCLARAAREARNRVALGHVGAPWLAPAERVPVVAWSMAPRAIHCEDPVVAIRWASPCSQTLPTQVHASAARRIQIWLYRHKDAVFTFSGRLIALAGRPKNGFLARVEHSFVIPGVGYLVSGWLVDPLRRIKSVSLSHAARGCHFMLSQGWTRVSREQIDRFYRPFLLPEPPRGYIALAHTDSLSTEPDAEAVKVRVHFDRGSQDISEGAHRLVRGPEAVRRLLSALSSDAPRLRDLMSLVGPALAALHRHHEPLRALSRSFGPVSEQPEVSVVVPVTERWSALRYQLAAFSQDPELRAAEWLYVIQDRRLVPEVLDAADALYTLFGLPFRLVYSERSLGLSEGRNLGAREARGDLLLLLSSGVLPLSDGWLTQMRSALTREVAAVGAVLLSEDGSVAHAGIDHESYAPWDDLQIATFPRRGFPEALLTGLDANWPAVTAACLLTRRTDYLSLGGLSPAFLGGDFADADLCRRLREGGRSIRIAPGVRLLHLLDRSAGYNGDANSEEPATLYDCWLFNERRETSHHGPSS